jgi:hypothetical protein
MQRFNLNGQPNIPENTYFPAKYGGRSTFLEKLRSGLNRKTWYVPGYFCGEVAIAAG